MTADEHQIVAREAVETAIKALTEIVINRVTGKFTNIVDYKEKMKKNLFSLIEVREKL